MHVEYKNQWYPDYMLMVIAVHNVFCPYQAYEELFFNTSTNCVDCFDNVNKGGKKIHLWSRIIGLTRQCPPVPLDSHLSIR